MHTGNNHVFQVCRYVSSLCFAVWKNTTCSNMALSLSLFPCRALSTATTVTQKRVKRWPRKHLNTSPRSRNDPKCMFLGSFALCPVYLTDIVGLKPLNNSTIRIVVRFMVLLTYCHAVANQGNSWPQIAIQH